MAASKSVQQASMVIYLAVVLAVAVAAFVVIRNIAATQSQAHQQSISPVFTLIEEELIEPLHIAKTLGTIGVYQPYLASEQPDQEEVITQLQHYRSLFDLEFYIAHERSRKQFNSDGQVFDLIDGEVFWYFSLKEEPQDVLAVLGKREDVHFYVDVKQFDQDGDFIGFVGVGKSLKDFLISFREFREKYGHEFVFVNNRNEIVLSSRKELLPQELEFKHLTDLSWYDDFLATDIDEQERSKLVESEQGDLLISEFNIETLNWKLYIITPLNERQDAINKTFLIYAGLFFLVLLVVFKFIQKMMEIYYQKISSKFHFDPLTKLANRIQLQEFFQRVRKHSGNVAIIVADIDHFKKINDSYGHNAGDKILRSVAQILNDSVRKIDLVGRWGGEEFVIILPNTEHNQALAIAEKCRAALAKEVTHLPQSELHVTASFGVAESENQGDALPDLFELADKAMYRAKKEGRNRVCKAQDLEAD